MVEKLLIRNPILKFTFLIPFALETPTTGFRDLDHPHPRFGHPNLGFGKPNLGFGYPILGVGCSNPRFRRPNLRFGRPILEFDMDVQILVLNVPILDLVVQILDLHVQIQDLDIQIPDFRQGPAEIRNFISQYWTQLRSLKKFEYLTKLMRFLSHVRSVLLN